MSDSLWPHELQQARPPCPSPTPGVYPNLCPLSRWCHPTISSSVIPFSSCPQSFPASGSFQMSQLFAWGGQSIGVSASTSVLPMDTQDRSSLGWTGWISLQSKELSRVFSNTTVQKHQFFSAQLSWNIRSMKQGKLELVKQETARASIDILGISKLKWKGMGKFNSDDHYIYYCGQESPRRNGVALTVNKRVWNALLGCHLKNDRTILVCFQGKPLNITVIQV